jgi:hypothetical protein
VHAYLKKNDIEFDPPVLYAEPVLWCVAVLVLYPAWHTIQSVTLFVALTVPVRHTTPRSSTALAEPVAAVIAEPWAVTVMVMVPEAAGAAWQSQQVIRWPQPVVDAAVLVTPVFHGAAILVLYA